MLKKVLSTTLAISLISSSSFALTQQEAQKLLNNSQNTIANSINSKVESNKALLAEIKKVKSDIKELKADIKKNRKDGRRSLVISAALVTGVVLSAQLLYHTRLGEILGGDRAGAAQVQALVFVVGTAGTLVSLGNAGLNYTLVYIDQNDVDELDLVLQKLQDKIIGENIALTAAE